jgi:hypothetical protein
MPYETISGGARSRPAHKNSARSARTTRRKAAMAGRRLEHRFALQYKHSPSGRDRRLTAASPSRSAARGTRQWTGSVLRAAFPSKG